MQYSKALQKIKIKKNYTGPKELRVYKKGRQNVTILYSLDSLCPGH